MVRHDKISSFCSYSEHRSEWFVDSHRLQDKFAAYPDNQIRKLLGTILSQKSNRRNKKVETDRFVYRCQRLWILF
ncbi:hypothetical protein Pfo_027853, partial [Paulownia fortunei]